VGVGLMLKQRTMTTKQKQLYAWYQSGLLTLSEYAAAKKVWK